MSASDRTRFFKRALLAVWGMATLILLFSLGLLTYDLMQRGYTPLPPRPTPDAAEQKPFRGSAASVRRSVTLYFSNADATGLVGEIREFQIGPFTQENCRTVLDALIAGPRAQERAPILPPTAKVRSVFLLENGELVIDFSREIQTDPTRPKSASAEALMMYGIANTLAQTTLKGERDIAVRRIRLLFEGSPFPPTFPEHLDFSQSVEPDPGWFAQEGTGGSYGS